jgi:peroxiredoxin
VKSKFLKFPFVILFVLAVFLACKERTEKSSLPKIGTAAIDFSCQDLKGQTWNLDKIKGKVVLLRFWTDWCPHCRYEMPVIENYYRKLNKEGFVVLAVNVKQRPQVAEAFTAQFDVTFPVLIDLEGKLAQTYGVHSIPTNFLIDRQGVVREIRVGDLFKDKTFMQALVKYFSKE